MAVTRVLADRVAVERLIQAHLAKSHFMVLMVRLSQAPQHYSLIMAMLVLEQHRQHQNLLSLVTVFLLAMQQLRELLLSKVQERQRLLVQFKQTVLPQMVRPVLLRVVLLILVQLDNLHTMPQTAQRLVQTVMPT